jgi:hypothetical protein
MKKHLLLIVLVGTVWNVQAQDRLDREPGYVDFKGIEEWFQTEPKLEVNIRGALLKLVSEASRHEDPELTSLLGKLKAIHVRGYTIDRSDFPTVERRAAELSRRLENQGWDTVVRVRDESERVDMFVRVVNDAIAGLVVMVVSPYDRETVFVNIVGEIDPEQIGRIGSKFQIGALGRAESRGRR